MFQKRNTLYLIDLKSIFPAPLNKKQFCFINETYTQKKKTIKP